MWVEPEESKNNVNGQPSPFQAPSVGAGAGGAAQPAQGTSSNPSTQTPVQANQPKQEFATVQDYLSNNKPQAEQLGQQFTSKLDATKDADKSAISGAAGTALNAVSSGTTAFDSGLVDKAKTDPTAVAGNGDQLGSFLKQWNASYTGPDSFEKSAAYNDAATAANDAGEKKAQLDSAGGREQILEDNFGVYGQGNKGLDQTLLQSSSAFPKVQEQAKEFGGIQDYLKQNADSVNSAATAAKAATEATKQQTQDAFSGSLTGFQDDLNKRVADKQAAVTANADRYKADLASGSASKVIPDLESAGVTGDQAKNIQDYLSTLNKNYQQAPDLSQGYSFNPSVNIDASNVASAGDYAKAAALQKLTGKDYSGVLNPANASKAGTAANGDTIDASDLESHLKTQVAQADKSLLDKGAPVIGSAMKNLADPEEATTFAQKYVDALKRTGQETKGNPILGNMFAQAQRGYMQYMNQPQIRDSFSNIIKVLKPFFY